MYFARAFAVVATLIPSLRGEPFGVQVERLTRPSPTVPSLCGGMDTSATQGAGAAYSWCQRLVSAAKAAPDKYRAHSFGIFTFDRWSQTLSNKYGLTTELYDCYATAPLAGVWAKYDVPYVRHDVCLGAEDAANGDGQGHRFNSLHAILRNHTPLSALVKLDIEGWEWQVIRSLGASDASKILLLDLEMHWCEGPAHPSKLQHSWAPHILEALRFLKGHFIVADRMHGRGNMSYAAIGCTDATKIYTMMSISYINRKVFSRRFYGFA